MAIKKYSPRTPSRRFLTTIETTDITADKPLKSLIVKKTRSGGRNSYGRATNINTGGGHKQRYRLIDFARSKRNVPGTVATIEYDPNRTCRIALIQYKDGEKRYILAPLGLNVGDTIIASEEAEIKAGNALPLKSIPVGVEIHNIEMKAGRGGQLVRSAGVAAQLIAKEGEYGLIRLPSGEMRKVHLHCFATIGTVGNHQHGNMMIGKAGRHRWMGRRPHNRGVTKNPVDHPMGGGEGRSSGGRHPCTPKGKPTKGYKTRHNKRTDKFIVRRRSAVK